MKFECEVIPLYKFTAEFECKEPGKDWKWVVVSDTLYGIAEKIIERCVGNGEDDLKDCRKSLCVTDFLKMQCEGLKEGFHLLDIDEYDCAGYGYAMIDEQFVETSFGAGCPIPVCVDLITEEMMSEAYLSGHNDEVTNRLEYYGMSDALGDEIYLIAIGSNLFKERKERQDSSERREKHVASKRIMEITKESLL